MKNKTKQLGTNVQFKKNIYIYITTHTRANHWTGVGCISWVACNSAAQVMEQSCMETYLIIWLLAMRAGSAYLPTNSEMRLSPGHLSLQWNWWIIWLWVCNLWGIVTACNEETIDKYNLEPYIFSYGL